MPRFKVLIGPALLVLMLLFDKSSCKDIQLEEQEAVKYLEEIEEKVSAFCNKEMEAEFNYNADMSPENSAAKAAAIIDGANFLQKVQKHVLETFPNWKDYKSDFTRVQVRSYGSRGPGNTTMDMVQKFENLKSEILKLRGAVTICERGNKGNCTLRHYPEVNEYLVLSKDVDVLTHYWTEWQNAIGSSITPTMYEELKNRSNLFAAGHGYSSTVHMWFDAFSDDTPNWSAKKFEEQLYELLNEVEEYYIKLHAYLRMKLTRSRGPDLKLPEHGYLPIHLLGNFLAQDFSVMATETAPFKDLTYVNVGQALVDANYTPIKIVESAEQFFMGLNEDWKLPQSFWDKSFFVRPADGKVNPSCHPQAFDLCANNDLRLHMCIEMSEFHLKTAYHELGHIFYYMSYAHLPYVYRNGANPGFHEAIGDTIALSIITPKHLKCDLGLATDPENKIKCGHPEDHPIDEHDINFLYSKALKVLPLFPFGLAIETWRSKVFNGSIGPSEYNNEWWKLRKQLSGVVPPAPRPPEMLDIIEVFHVANNMVFANYLISEILQYQFYEALCIAAGEYDPNDPKSAPLHRCDFAKSRKAGSLLKKMLEKGCSKDWSSVLEILTGTRELTVRPLIHYFQPVFDHIEKELNDNNIKPCFGSHC